MKEHYRSGYFCTSLFICLPHSWAGCALGVEYSLAFPSVARKKQMFQFLSPLPMLPYATFPTVGHQCWHTGPGLCTGEALRGSLALQCLRALCGAVRRAGHTSVNFEGKHMAPRQHLPAAQSRHPGVLLATGTSGLSVRECSRVLPHGLLLCYCLMAFTCRGCVAVCEQREPSEPCSSASARQSVG